MYCKSCHLNEDDCLCNHECQPDFNNMTIGGSKGILYLETSCRLCGMFCDVAVGHEDNLEWDFREI